MPEPAANAERFRLLQALGLLDATPDPALDRFVRIAAEASKSPIALVTFLGPESQVNKARVGLEEPYTPLADAFCYCALDSPELLEVPDALADERFAHCALVTGPALIRSYAGHPILLAGLVLGTVCVMDTVVRAFAAADRHILADLSGIVSDLLALRHEQLLRQQEQRRAADCAAAAGEWLWETDAAHRIAWLAGDLDAEMTRAAGDVVGQPVVDRPLLSWTGQPLETGVTLFQMLDRQEAFSGAVVAYRGDVPSRLCERSASPFFDPDGRFQGFRGSCRDVTARVRAEVMALKSDAAHLASRSKSEFLSRVSHELRTPLNAILGFGQLMLMETSDAHRPTAVQRERLEAMRLAGERLLSLINDMLDLARIEQGRLDLDMQPLDVFHLVQAAEMLLRPTSADRSIRIRSLVQAGECFVLADERALGQVLLNLFSNAVKYNREGGLVTVRVERDDRVRIKVEDNGVGMTPSQLESLFQPFNRLGAEGGVVPGSGLGLVISKLLVERMRGTIRVESLPGIGTTVEVALAPADAGRASVPSASAPGASAEAVAAVQRRVLYVEDDAVNALLMDQLMLSNPTWTLVVAPTGEAGIDLAASSRFDLILIDMHLPDMSGLQVFWALRDRNIVAPRGTIALSADALPEQINVALQSGFDEYWTKPLDLTEALRRLHTLLGSRPVAVDAARLQAGSDGSGPDDAPAR